MVRMVRTRVLLLVAAALVFLWCWGDVAVPALCWLTNGQLCPEGVRKASSPYNRQVAVDSLSLSLSLSLLSLIHI